MILRILFFFLLVYLFLKLYFSLRRSPRKPRRDDAAGRGEEMVLDPQCRSYVPKSDALVRGGQYFCSERCASLYLAGRSS
jgi:hypothetical protein